MRKIVFRRPAILPVVIALFMLTFCSVKAQYSFDTAFATEALCLKNLRQTQIAHKTFIYPDSSLGFVSGYNIIGTINTSSKGFTGFFYLPYLSAKNNSSYTFHLNNTEVKNSPLIKDNSYTEKYEFVNTKYFFKDQWLHALSKDIVITAARTTTTNYTGLFTYSDVKNNYFNSGLRSNNDDNNASLFWANFQQDPPGNMRMVFSDVTQTDVYTKASLETNNLSTERLYYKRADSARVEKKNIPDYPQTDISENEFVQRLNGNNAKIGTYMFIKVNSGDEISASVNAWYNPSSTDSCFDHSAGIDIVNILADNIKDVSIFKGNDSCVHLSVSDYLKQRKHSATTNTPSAFLNVLLFDDSLNAVSTSDDLNSTSQQVNQTTQVQTLSIVKRAFSKNGYALIFVSNETINADVYFDNLQITHTRRPAMEESLHPFESVLKKNANNIDHIVESDHQQVSSPTVFSNAVVKQATEPTTSVVHSGYKSPAMVITNNQFYYSNSNGDTVIYNNLHGEKISIVNNTSLSIEMVVDEDYYNNKPDHKFLNSRIGLNKIAAMAGLNISTELSDMFENSDEIQPMDDIIARCKNLILEFTGYAKDVLNEGKIRQQGEGRLNIYSNNNDGNTALVASYEALSGAMNNGLLPNGTYIVTRPMRVDQFLDEQGFGFKMILKPGSSIGILNRREFRIHPVQRLRYGKNIVRMPTEGCIGLSGGHDEIMFFYNTMVTYFKKHNIIQLHVNIKDNANVVNQLGGKEHY
ncbi:hypothetical protein QTN47_16695 [Danxiaibacter flavus]|uniref:Uncharacterized protein n=1 Tax=Danxiaibacter flavus TaxID=3049108 RepID=A0ABV3ZL21_9BACT|nr:hypothetical protein QNM32_16705 [Chitinophagaceae bacterium DXS]